MPPSDEVKVLDHCRVAPPPGSVPPSTLPLTYFDLVCYRFQPVQRLFLYQLPCSTSSFLDAHLPNLKLSLSLALKHFYPLAGRLIRPGLNDGEPRICYDEGDSVEFTVAESEDDFHDLIAHHNKDAARFHPLVPVIPLSETEQGLVAVQVTLFPEHGGIGIGLAAHHAVVDGSSSTHFMKTWGAIYRLGGDESLSSVLDLPVLDRSMIPDPHGLKKTFLAQWEEMWNRSSSAGWDLSGRTDLVRATFVLTRAQLDGLRQHVLTRTSTLCSPFVVGCAAAWVSSVKAREDATKERELFAFVSNCRGRLDDVPVTAAYFGNCIAFRTLEATRTELVGDSGLVAASTAIHGAVQGLKGGGALRGAERWLDYMFADWRTAGKLIVFGSPRQGVYGVEFGWGRARKVEVASIERTSAICLAENRDEEEGGFEVAIGLSRRSMEVFAAAMDQILKTCS